MESLSPSSSSFSSHASPERSPRRVAFAKVEIIELPMTVGDGPSLGVPLTVDWEAQERSTFGIDFFEQYRPERRGKNKLRIGPESREKLLLKNGCTEDEILAGMEKASILRSDRKTTLHHLDTLEQVTKHHLNTNC